MLFIEADRMLHILLDFHAGLDLVCVVDGLACGAVDHLNVRVFYLELSSEGHFLDG